MDNFNIPHDIQRLLISFVSDDFHVFYYLWKNNIPNFLHIDLHGLNWSAISKRTDLPDSFYIDFSSYIDWITVANIHMDDFSFLKRFSAYMPWKYISRNKFLSNDFITTFENCLDWDLLSLHCDLPFKILEEKDDKINWCYIKFNQNIPIYHLKHFLKHQFFRQYMTSQ